MTVSQRNGSPTMVGLAVQHLNGFEAERGQADFDVELDRRFWLEGCEKLQCKVGLGTKFHDDK